MIEFAIMASDGRSRQFYVRRGGLQFSSDSFASGGFEEGSARVTILAGDGEVVPYGSIIDNATADAVYVMGEMPPNMTTTSSALSGRDVSVFEKLMRMRD